MDSEARRFLERQRRAAGPGGRQEATADRSPLSFPLFLSPPDTRMEETRSRSGSHIKHRKRVLNSQLYKALFSLNKSRTFSKAKGRAEFTPAVPLNRRVGADPPVLNPVTYFQGRKPVPRDSMIQGSAIIWFKRAGG